MVVLVMYLASSRGLASEGGGLQPKTRKREWSLEGLQASSSAWALHIMSERRPATFDPSPSLDLSRWVETRGVLTCVVTCLIFA